MADRDGTVSRTSTQARGAATVSFQVAVHYDATTWQYWILNNSSNQKWLFFGCDVYELLA
ncbi:hypothetical protein [Amycolatopsis sp. NPDC051371]|uniref:hypothetical protein n=1 Tax=Amycolatopsis sp. NPDC051371 TaxID=3155800 RepID=UPI0034205400